MLADADAGALRSPKPRARGSTIVFDRSARRITPAVSMLEDLVQRQSQSGGRPPSDSDSVLGAGVTEMPPALLVCHVARDRAHAALAPRLAELAGRLGGRAAARFWLTRPQTQIQAQTGSLGGGGEAGEADRDREVGRGCQWAVGRPDFGAELGPALTSLAAANAGVASAPREWAFFLCGPPPFLEAARAALAAAGVPPPQVHFESFLPESV